MAIHRPLTPLEEEEANRTRRELAELAFMVGLLWARRERSALAMAGVLTAEELIAQVRATAAGTIGDIRSEAAENGVGSAGRQLPTLSLSTPSIAGLALYPVWRTVRRYASGWGGFLKQAEREGLSRAEAARKASAEMSRTAAGIAGTEASQAYNGARRKAVLAASRSTNLVLLEKWVTEFGPNTCERCDFADGQIVRAGDDFPEGVPGAVHPRCHCTSIFLYETPEAAWLLTG